MKRYYSFCGYTLCISSEFEVCIYSLRQHLPQIKQLSEGLSQGQPVRVCIKLLASSQEGVEIKESEIGTGGERTVELEVRYHTSLTDIIIGDVPHLSYCVMKRFLFSKGIYFLHSTLINQSLFLAPSGGGKSSLALHALEQRVKVYSFNKTAVRFNAKGELEFIAGTDLLSNRTQLELRQAECLGLDFIKQNGDRFLYDLDMTSKSPSGTLLIKKIVFLGGRGRGDVNAVTSAVENPIHSLYKDFLDSACSDCVLAMGEGVYCPQYSAQDKAILLNRLRGLRVGVFFTNKEAQQILKNG